MYNSRSLNKLIIELERMPGIGPKTAQRLAFYILKSSNKEIEELAMSITKAKENVRYCSICFNFTEQDPCKICNSSSRDSSIVCVVEEPSDVLAIERTGEYKGKYHVLLGTISPLDGIGPDELKIKDLLKKLAEDKVKEVILATNSNVEGETTAIYLSKLIKPFKIKVSRLAHGLPIGGDLEYADEITISKALSGRTEM